jgi:hypothetical protein
MIRVGLHIDYSILFFATLTGTGACRQILAELANMKFHEKSFSTSRI